MAKIKHYEIGLNEEQLDELIENGSITVGQETIDVEDIQFVDTPDTDYTNQQIDEKVNGVKLIVGTTDPTSSTVGYVGQLYLNSESGANFQCKAIEEEGGVYTYVWEELSAGIPIEGEW